MKKITIDKYIRVIQRELMTYMMTGHQGEVSCFELLKRELIVASLEITDGKHSKGTATTEQWQN